MSLWWQEGLNLSTSIRASRDLEKQGTQTGRERNKEGTLSENEEERRERA
jgi:hypothetical protein